MLVMLIITLLFIYLLGNFIMGKEIKKNPENLKDNK